MHIYAEHIFAKIRMTDRWYYDLVSTKLNSTILNKSAAKDILSALDSIKNLKYFRNYFRQNVISD